MATSPPPSRGPRTGRNCYATPTFLGVPNARHGDKIRSGYLPLAFSGAGRGWNCYVTPAFSGVPNAKHGDKIRNGYLTPAFSGAQNRAQSLRNPYILGGPQRQARGQNQKWPTGGTSPTCIHFNKIGNFFFAVRSYNFHCALNTCKKKSSRRVIFFCGKPCIFFAVSRVFFFAVSRVNKICHIV